MERATTPKTTTKTHRQAPRTFPKCGNVWGRLLCICELSVFVCGGPSFGLSWFFVPPPLWFVTFMSLVILHFYYTSVYLLLATGKSKSNNNIFRKRRKTNEVKNHQLHNLSICGMCNIRLWQVQKQRIAQILRKMCGKAASTSK